jgi:hypothetical protein
MTADHKKRRREAKLRQKLRRQILSGVQMLDEAEVHQLLYTASTDATWCSLQLQDQFLRFRIAGKWNYPAFQFDMSSRTPYPGLVQIVAVSKAAGWSNFRLLNWMMLPHMDFDGTPADSLQNVGGAVLEAFLRASEPEYHG